MVAIDMQNSEENSTVYNNNRAQMGESLGENSARCRR